MIQLAWLIPIFPLLGFLVIGFLNKRLPVSLSGGIASVTIFLSFVLSLIMFYEISLPGAIPERILMFDWIVVGDLNIPFSLLIDRLSVIMLLVITGVGFLIHVYSIGYMHHEQDHPRFFSYLN